MVLPRGITGFWDSGSEPPAVSDVPAFRVHCHEAARQTGGRVVSIAEPNPGGMGYNFIVAVLSLPAGRVAAVLSAIHPLVAFADPPADGEMALRFRDCPELAASFNLMDVYRVSSADEMNCPPTPNSLAELSPAERKQVAYWKPRRLGDVVFNWWD